MTSEKPRRRWFRPRFSLTTLLVVVTVICCWLGYQVNKAERQRRQVAQIRAAGGLVTYRLDRNASLEELDILPGNPPLPGPNWLHGWLGVDYFFTVDSIRLYKSVPQDVLKNLADLQGIEHVDFMGSGTLTDDDLPCIMRVSSIRGLTLDGKKLSTAGVMSLASMKQLRALWINHNRVRAGQIAELMIAHPTCSISITNAADDDQ